MSDPDWERDFADLREGYRLKLARNLLGLDARFRRRAQGPLPRDELESVRQLAHRLKGTAGCYGFDVASAALARIEEQLEGLLKVPGPYPARAWHEIERALERARGDVDG